MGLIAVLVIFSVLGFLAYLSRLREVESNPLFSKDPEVRARILAEYEARGAAARALSPVPFKPAQPQQPARRRVTKVEFMLGYRD